MEFKVAVPPKLHGVLKTLIAFANSYGGQLVIGVADTGEVVGIAEDQVDDMVSDLQRAIHDAIHPHVFASLYTKRLGDALLLIIDVAEGASKPYHLSAKGIQQGTYLRLGAHTMLANIEGIHQLQWQNQWRFLDAMPVYGADEDAIDQEAFAQFLKNRKQKEVHVNPSEMLFHYRILVKDRARVYPTVGGLLLFGRDPYRYFPEAFVICTRFLGTSGREVVATRDCQGALFNQYKEAVAFVLSQLNTAFKIEGVGPREENLEVPPEAIREIVLNAIVHRNYHTQGPSKIAIYDDRIEIFSPGHFPGPLMVDKVNIGVTYIRNSVITKIFRDIGLIEKLGSGFMTLFDAYAKAALPEPSVLEGADFVKCILPRRPLGGQIQGVSHTDDASTDRLHILKQHLSQQGSMGVSDVMGWLSVSRSTASRLLKEGVEKGMWRKQGRGPALKYMPVSS